MLHGHISTSHLYRQPAINATNMILGGSLIPRFLWHFLVLKIFIQVYKFKCKDLSRSLNA